LVAPYKMALGQEPFNDQVLPPSCCLFLSSFSLDSIHIYGLIMGQSPPHTDFNKRGHPQGWCTQRVLEECFWRLDNAEAWGRHEVDKVILCGVLWPVCPERLGFIGAQQPFNVLQIVCPERHGFNSAQQPLCLSPEGVARQSSMAFSGAYLTLSGC